MRETEDFYRDIANDAEKKFDTRGYSKDECHSEKKKNLIGMMKDELDGKIMTDFVTLRTKMHAYKKIDKNVKDMRYKGTKKCVAAESV